MSMYKSRKIRSVKRGKVKMVKMMVMNDGAYGESNA